MPFLKYLEICDPSLTSYTGRRQKKAIIKTGLLKMFTFQVFWPELQKTFLEFSR